MKIKNKVLQIVCNGCGCNKAELIVGTKSEQYEDDLGLNAEGLMVDGMGGVHELEGEMLNKDIENMKKKNGVKTLGF